jgi:hypothetical protein
MNGGRFGPAEKRRTAKVGVHACNTAKLMSLSTRELIFRIVGSGGRGARKILSIFQKAFYHMPKTLHEKTDGDLEK